MAAVAAVGTSKTPKASAVGVRRVRGGYIVTYREPVKPSFAQAQQAVSLAAAMMASYDDREIVCASLEDVAALLVELLGDGEAVH